MTASGNGLISDNITSSGGGEIQTRNLQNTSLQCYTYINLTNQPTNQPTNQLSKAEPFFGR